MGGGGGGGGALRFRPIQSMRCLRSRQIQPVDGGCCPLSANSASGGAHVVNRGGGGAPFSPEGGGGAMAPPGDAHGTIHIYSRSQVAVVKNLIGDSF